jgi:hypothetical protein
MFFIIDLLNPFRLLYYFLLLTGTWHFLLWLFGISEDDLKD